MDDGDWQDDATGCLGMLLCGAAALDDDDLVLLVFNQTASAVSFVLPDSDTFSTLFGGWQLAISTDAALPSGMLKHAGTKVTIPEACVCVFEPRRKDEDERGDDGEYRSQADGCA